MSTEIDAIKNVLRQWVAAINARRAGAILKLVSDDVVFIQPPAVPFRGKAAVGRLYHAAFHAYDVREQIQFLDIRVIGSLATARVTEHIECTPRVGGKAVGFTETDAMRFRHQSDGAWKLVSRSLTAPSSPLSNFVSFAQHSQALSTFALSHLQDPRYSPLRTPDARLDESVDTAARRAVMVPALSHV
jgi:uncharacterized protein (TIGR02246 family)